MAIKVEGFFWSNRFILTSVLAFFVGVFFLPFPYSPLSLGCGGLLGYSLALSCRAIEESFKDGV